MGSALPALAVIPVRSTRGDWSDEVTTHVAQTSDGLAVDAGRTRTRTTTRSTAGGNYSQRSPRSDRGSTRSGGTSYTGTAYTGSSGYSRSGGAGTRQGGRAGTVVNPALASGVGTASMAAAISRAEFYQYRAYAGGTCVATGAHMCGLEDFSGVRFADLPQAAAGAGGVPVRPGAAPADPAAPAAAGRPAQPEVDIVTVIQQAVANVQLPEPVLHLGPEPDVNEWNMIAVGQPVWFWTDDPGAVDGSTSQQGIQVTLVARPVATVIDTGDGATITCTESTPRPPDSEPMATSPTCGHTWLKPGTRQVTATTTWSVDWSVLGVTGNVMMDRSTSRTLDVGELVSVVVR